MGDTRSIDYSSYGNQKIWSLSPYELYPKLCTWEAALGYLDP